MTFSEHNPKVDEIWYQPPAPGVEECVSIKVHGGPKTYLRIWPRLLDHGIEWGWVVHDSATKIYELEVPDAKW